MLPLSLVLLTPSDAYLDGLTAYRYDAPASSGAARSRGRDLAAPVSSRI